MNARALLAAILAVPASVSVTVAGAPTASPQRPSLSYNTSTVPRGYLELEMGAFAAEASASLPLTLKFGATDRFELSLGTDTIRRVEGISGDVTSVGDVTAAVRARFAETSRGASFAAVGFVKLPTAEEGAGSGETDIGAVLIGSTPLGRCALDLNLWATALGSPGGRVGQAQGVATFSFPPAGSWGSYLEAAWQQTAGGEGSGTFIDAGISYSASERSIFDAAVGKGVSDGYADWTATVGWTVLLGKVLR